VDSLLLITSDEALTERLGLILKNSRFRLVSTSPGPSLPGYLHQHFFFAVLMDIRLPDFQHHVHTITMNSPLSSVIALHETDQRRRAVSEFKSGVWAALPLDVTREEMVRTIRSVIEHQVHTNFGVTSMHLDWIPIDQSTAAVLTMHLTRAIFLAEHEGMLEQSQLSELFITAFLMVMKKLLECEKISILLTADTRGDVLINLRPDIKQTIPATVKLKERGQVTTYIIDHGKPILVDDIERDDRFQRKSKRLYSTPSFVAVPVKIHNRIIAIINATDKTNGQPFTLDDLGIVSGLVKIIEETFEQEERQDQTTWMERSFLVERMSQGTTLLKEHIQHLRGELNDARMTLNHRINELSAIYKADEIIQSTLVLEELLMMVTNLVVTVMECDKSSVLLLNKDDDPDILVRGSRKIMRSGKSLVTRLTTRGKVTRYIMDTTNPLLVTNQNRREDLFAEQTDRYRTRSFVSVPVFLKDSIVAIVNATDKVAGEDFDSEDLKLLEFLANQISKSMEKFELTRHLVHAQQVEYELKVAAGLQKSILPKTFPEMQTIQLAAYNQPAREMAGDFYDVFLLPDGRLALLLADVTGKGIPAAFYSALVLSHVKALCTRYRSPKTIGLKTNTFLSELDPDSCMFVTMFLGFLKQETGELTFVLTGHDPPILLHRGGKPELLQSRGFMLGIFPEMLLKQQKITLQPDDLLVVYTDGLTDAHDKQEERFGRDRLLALLSDEHPRSAQQALDLITGTLNRYAAGAEPFDDITILTVYRDR